MIFPKKNMAEAVAYETRFSVTYYDVLTILGVYTFIVLFFFMFCCCFGCRSGKPKVSELTRTHDKVTDILDEIVKMRESMAILAQTRLLPLNTSDNIVKQRRTTTASHRD